MARLAFARAKRADPPPAEKIKFYAYAKFSEAVGPKYL